MKIHMVEQGSGDWHRLRLGIPTASEADSLVTPKTGALSASWRGYAYKLLAERLLNASGTSLDDIPYIARGKDLEPEAVRQYEFAEEVETLPVGFITDDAGRFGASPDRLIAGRKAGVEIKCPAAHTHIGYLLSGQADKYRPQVQMQLYVCDFEYVDFYSFHPRCPPALIRTNRDEPYIKLLASALDEFCDKVDEMERRARTIGVFQPFETFALPISANSQDAVQGRHAFEYLAA